MAKYTYKAPGLTVAEIESAVAGIVGYDTSNSAQLAEIDQAVTAAGLAAATWDGSPWWWQRGTATFQTNQATVATSASSGAVRSSNIVTITTTAAHGLQAGQTVRIADVADSTFEGTYLISNVPSTTSFQFPQVGDDATSGSGTVYALSYPVRSVDVAGDVTGTDSLKVAWELWSVERAYYDDDWSIRQVTWGEFLSRMRLLASTAPSKPYLFALSGEPPLIWLWPVPDSNYDIHLDFIKRHSKIEGGASGADDAALIVPPEFHWDVYVNGAAWLLKHKTADPQPLRSCPAFVAAMARMAAADPAHYAEENSADMFPDARRGRYPNDRRVYIDGQWVLVENPPSLT